jgi:hypothetical protein
VLRLKFKGTSCGGPAAGGHRTGRQPPARVGGGASHPWGGEGVIVYSYTLAAFSSPASHSSSSLINYSTTSRHGGGSRGFVPETTRMFASRAGQATRSQALGYGACGGGTTRRVQTGGAAARRAGAARGGPGPRTALHMSTTATHHSCHISRLWFRHGTNSSRHHFTPCGSR